MMVRIFKGVWLMSLLGTVVVLLYSYASFPEVIQVQGGADGQGVTRNNLFYAVLGMLAIFNALVFVINRVTPEEDAFFKIWFFGLVVFFNLFITVSLQFFSLYNSQEKFDYDSIGTPQPCARQTSVFSFIQPSGVEPRPCEYCFVWRTMYGWYRRVAREGIWGRLLDQLARKGQKQDQAGRWHPCEGASRCSQPGGWSRRAGHGQDAWRAQHQDHGRHRWARSSGQAAAHRSPGV